MKYFSPNGLGECTLAESFSQVPLHYQIANHDHENATFVRYNELVSNYERSKGPLSETQHAELILILEKRLAKCKTKYKMSPSSVRSEGGEAAAGYCPNSVSYRVDEAVKYNVLNSD